MHAFHLSWIKQNIWNLGQVVLGRRFYFSAQGEGSIWRDPRHWKDGTIQLVLAAQTLVLCPAALLLWAWAAGLMPGSLWNVVFSLGPSMVGRTALVLILSTSFVIQKNAKSTLRTSGPNSANSVTHTLTTRIPNTTGCRMNIPTVSAYHSFACCVDGHLVFKPCWHQALALLGSAYVVT